MDKDNYILYILMRNDLPSMNAGRAMAMASHATSAFLKEFGNVASVGKWKKQTKQDFGTVIVLGANRAVIESTLNFLNHNDDWIDNSVLSDEVYDPEYGMTVSGEVYSFINPQLILNDKTVFNDNNSVTFFRNEMTCAYIFGKKESLRSLLGDISLHP